MSSPNPELKKENRLDDDLLSSLSAGEKLTAYKAFLNKKENQLEKRHLTGASGVEIAAARSTMADQLITAISRQLQPPQNPPTRIALIATGGYGRQLLNPGSDLDLLFLTPHSASKITEEQKKLINDIQMILWDLGFKLLPATRSIAESIAEARREPQSRTALFDSRLLTGNQKLFTRLQNRFHRECIKKDLPTFFKERQQDLRARRQKYDDTVFLQEPHIKDSPGGMRDFHNFLWLIDAQRGTRDFKEIKKQKILSAAAAREMTQAFDFLHRVRNALHHRGKGNDILTLRLQGELAKEFKYPQKTILRQIEALMRDYYTHARSIHHHTRSVFEIFSIEQEDQSDQGFLSRLSFRKKNKTLKLDDYTLKNSRLSPRRKTIFTEKPSRILRLFLYCQQNDAHPSPSLRKLIKEHWHLIDRPFRYRKSNRESFREILEQKGKVATTLRLMHRSGVLGHYLPEFGAMDCLVQHEFFHRYTADEHTLRTIDQLDALINENVEQHQLYRDLFIKHPDPYALYLALILHDTGRAENVREHIDGSALLAARVCKRLHITGGRRSLITFLVDHHLTLWRYATKKDIDDPAVISEFAGLMRDRHRLDALLLFTFADSIGTNEKAWSPWKESLILRLYRSTREFLLKGAQTIHNESKKDLQELRRELFESLDTKYHKIITEQFEQMPKRYFRFRSKRSLPRHIRAVWQYIDRRTRRPNTPFECAAQWIARPKFCYTELILATHDRPLLLEKICCVMAAHQISIHSAEIYTRLDGVALDLFRVSTDQDKALEDTKKQADIIKTLYQINEIKEYHPEKFLKKKTNYLHTETEQVVDFPTRAWISNELDRRFTVIEIQALDRIGLLHDVFQTLAQNNLLTTHARICTEKGAALDSFYVTTSDGTRLDDPSSIQTLQRELETIIR